MPPTSPARFNKIKVAAKINQQARTTGKSRLETASTNACPMPGYPNTTYTRTTPVIR